MTSEARSASAPPVAMQERILTVATELFAERGFHGTSLTAVAEAVGIRKPSLLYHFPSKAALRQAVLDEMLVHWRADIGEVLARSHGQLSEVLEAMIGYLREAPHRARLLVREALDNPEGLKELFRKHLKPWTGILTEHIRAGQAQGAVREGVDAAAYVQHMIYLGVGFVALADIGEAMVPGADGRTDALLAELARVARTSLYRQRAEPERAAQE